VNKTAERMFGYSAAEMIGRNVMMLMPEPFSSRHDSYVSRYRKTKIGHIGTLPIVRESHTTQKKKKKKNFS
jgi:PAS domain S-box-containing protein